MSFAGRVWRSGAATLIVGCLMSALQVDAKAVVPSSGRRNAYLASRACPHRSVVIRPSESIQAAIDRRGRNTTFCIKPGRYRLRRSIRPKTGDRLIFQRGAVLDGSRVVRNWTRSGSLWVASGQSQTFGAPGIQVPCDLNAAACEYEDLFMDGRPMRRALSQAGLSRGEFFFDESEDKMYIVNEPQQHRFEATVTDTAIEAGGTQRVTIRGATIEQFAHHGIATGNDWNVIRNRIRYVHSHGMRVFGGTEVRGNFIHHAGNMGLFADGGDLVFVRNHLAYNNYLRFGTATGAWHAGATKIINSRNVVVRNNKSHNNFGDGWWFDTDNRSVLVKGNQFFGNTRCGLFYEASFTATIRRNSFRNNGASQAWGGGGICINSSGNILASRNRFRSSKDAAVEMTMADRDGPVGVHRTENVVFRNNVFKVGSGLAVSVTGLDQIFSSRNRFVGNDYYVTNRRRAWWVWDGPRRWKGWRRIGHDTSGSLKKL